MDRIEQEVVSIVARLTKVPESRLTPDTDLRAELNVDSLQGLQIIAALEKHFGVTLADDELDSYTSVGSIAETVRRLHAEAKNR
jgi:acyl carrier protein